MRRRFAAERAAAAGPGASAARATAERLVQGPLSALVVGGKLALHPTWKAVGPPGRASTSCRSAEGRAPIRRSWPLRAEPARELLLQGVAGRGLRHARGEVRARLERRAGEPEVHLGEAVRTRAKGRAHLGPRHTGEERGGERERHVVVERAGVERERAPAGELERTSLHHERGRRHARPLLGERQAALVELGVAPVSRAGRAPRRGAPSRGSRRAGNRPPRPGRARARSRGLPFPRTAPGRAGSRRAPASPPASASTSLDARAVEREVHDVAEAAGEPDRGIARGLAAADVRPDRREDGPLRA